MLSLFLIRCGDADKFEFIGIIFDTPNELYFTVGSPCPTVKIPVDYGQAQRPAPTMV